MSNIIDKVMSSQEREFSFADVANALLALIKEREAEILRLRFGLTNNKRQTLDAIGKKMNLTRERVRQLENMAKNNIKKHQNFDGIMAPAKDKVILELENYGGLASRETITQALLLDEEIENHRQYLNFLVDNFVDEIKSVDHQSFLNGWYLDQDYLDLAHQVIIEIKKLIEAKNCLIYQDELLRTFELSELYNQNLDKFKDKDLKRVMSAYLDLSRDLGNTPFGQWGLIDWNLINPSRVNDKIYLVLDHYQKPMHFREIAEKINQAKFDNRIAHPATIHNDLIADERFVLLDRGVYALREWGYKTGMVADLVADILSEADQALDKEEIIKKVLGLRSVKPNTVILALNKDERFEKVGERYKLKMKN